MNTSLARRSRQRLRVLALAAGGSLLGACQMLTRVEPTKPEVETPEAWGAAEDPHQGPVPTELWWEGFESDDLALDGRRNS